MASQGLVNRSQDPEASLAPKDAALFKNMMELYNFKNYKKALKVAETILVKYPNHGETLSVKALLILFIEPTREDEIVELAKRGLRNGINSYLCWHVLGVIYKQLKKYKETVKCFVMALKLDPQNDRLIKEICCLQIELKDYCAFRRFASSQLKLKSKEYREWVMFAFSQHLCGNLMISCEIMEEADHLFKSNYKVEPQELSESIMYRAMLYEHTGQFLKCAKLLEDKAGLIKDNLTRLELKAKVLYLANSRLAANLTCKELLHINPNNARFVLLYFMTHPNERIRRLFLYPFSNYKRAEKGSIYEKKLENDSKSVLENTLVLPEKQDYAIVVSNEVLDIDGEYTSAGWSLENRLYHNFDMFVRAKALEGDPQYMGCYSYPEYAMKVSKMLDLKYLPYPDSLENIEEVLAVMDDYLSDCPGIDFVVYSKYRRHLKRDKYPLLMFSRSLSEEEEELLIEALDELDLKDFFMYHCFLFVFTSGFKFYLKAKKCITGSVDRGSTNMIKMFIHCLTFKKAYILLFLLSKFNEKLIKRQRIDDLEIGDEVRLPEHEVACNYRLLVVLLFLAKLYDFMGAFRKAIDLLDLGYKLAPTSIDVMCTRGKVYRHMGDYEASNEDFCKGTDIDKSDRQTNAKAAKATLRTKDFEASVTRWRSFLIEDVCQRNDKEPPPDVPSFKFELMYAQIKYDMYLKSTLDPDEYPDSEDSDSYRYEYKEYREDEYEYKEDHLNEHDGYDYTDYNASSPLPESNDNFDGVKDYGLDDFVDEKYGAEDEDYKYNEYEYKEEYEDQDYLKYTEKEEQETLDQLFEHNESQEDKEYREDEYEYKEESNEENLEYETPKKPEEGEVLEESQVSTHSGGSGGSGDQNPEDFEDKDAVSEEAKQEYLLSGDDLEDKDEEEDEEVGLEDEDEYKMEEGVEEVKEQERLDQQELKNTEKEEQDCFKTSEEEEQKRWESTGGYTEPEETLRNEDDEKDERRDDEEYKVNEYSYEELEVKDEEYSNEKEDKTNLENQEQLDQENWRLNESYLDRNKKKKKKKERVIETKEERIERGQNCLKEAFEKYKLVLEKHSEIYQNQLDFHNYCLNRLAMRVYYNFLKLRTLYCSQGYFIKALKGAIRCSLEMYSLGIETELELEPEPEVPIQNRIVIKTVSVVNNKNNDKDSDSNSNLSKDNRDEDNENKESSNYNKNKNKNKNKNISFCVQWMKTVLSQRVYDSGLYLLFYKLASLTKMDLMFRLQCISRCYYSSRCNKLNHHLIEIVFDFLLKQERYSEFEREMVRKTVELCVDEELVEEFRHGERKFAFKYLNHVMNRVMSEKYEFKQVKALVVSAHNNETFEFFEKLFLDSELLYNEITFKDYLKYRRFFIHAINSCTSYENKEFLKDQMELLKHLCNEEFVVDSF